MAKTLRVRLEAEDKAFLASIKSATRTTAKLMAQMVRQSKSANDVMARSHTSTTNRVIRNNQKMGNSFSSLRNLIIGAFTFRAAKDMISDLIMVGVEFDRLEKLMTAATKGVETFTESQQFLRMVSEELGQVYKDQVKLYAQLAAAGKYASISLNDIKDIYLGTMRAGTALQRTQEDMRLMMLAITQIASKGTVSMEELRRQLGERLPGAMGIAAKSMNMTTQELIKMVSTGNLLAKDFLPAFGRAMTEEFGGAAVLAAESAQAAINRFKTAFDNFRNDLAKGGMLDAFTEALEALRDGMADGEVRQAFIDMAEGIAMIAKHIPGLIVDLNNSESSLRKLISTGMDVLQLYVSFGLLFAAVNVGTAIISGFLSTLTMLRKGVFATAFAFQFARVAVWGFYSVLAALGGLMVGDFLNSFKIVRKTATAVIHSMMSGWVGLKFVFKETIDFMVFAWTGFVNILYRHSARMEDVFAAFYEKIGMKEYAATLRERAKLFRDDIKEQGTWAEINVENKKRMYKELDILDRTYLSQLKDINADKDGGKRGVFSRLIDNMMEDVFSSSEEFQKRMKKDSEKLKKTYGKEYDISRVLKNRESMSELEKFSDNILKMQQDMGVRSLELQDRQKDASILKVKQEYAAKMATIKAALMSEGELKFSQDRELGEVDADVGAINAKYEKLRAINQRGGQMLRQLVVQQRQEIQAIEDKYAADKLSARADFTIKYLTLLGAEKAAELETSRQADQELYQEFKELYEKKILTLQEFEAAKAAILTHMAAEEKKHVVQTRTMWDELYKVLEENAETIKRSFADGFGDAFIDFVQGTKSAKDAFRDFAKDFLDQLGRMIIKQTILNALNTWGGGQSGGIFGALFGGGKAAGGPVSAGTSYMVGERGPEMFTPSRSGTITPNGGSSVNTTINVSVAGGGAAGGGGSEEDRKRLGKDIAVVVKQAFNENLRQEMRPGGMLNRSA